MSKISVVIPAYKEAARIGVTLSSLHTYFQNSTHEPEVIVVDDGSPDTTAAVVAEYQSKMPYLQLIKLPENRGKGYAVKTGMLAATASLQLFMDADNSVDISHLNQFLAEHTKGFDIVIGSIELGTAKVKEKNGPLRRLLSKLSKIPVRLATPGIRDTQRGFKLFTQEASREIFSRQTIDRFGFDIEIIVIALTHKYAVRELPVTWINPTGSTITLRDYSRTFKELLQILVNKSLRKYARA